MSDHIPADLLSNILARLAVKDLLRFTTVCKSWRSLIASPNFISLHSARIAAAKNDLLLVRTYSEDCREKSEKEQYSIHFDDDTFGVYKRLDFPFKCYNFCFNVNGCINGVVFLSDDSYAYNNKVIILWNPSIRRYVSLPEPSSPHGPPPMQAFGFGFNPTTGGYKVVRLLYANCCLGRYQAPPEVEVYDTGDAGSWRSVDSKGFPYVVEHKTKQAFVNGAINWVGTNQLKTTPDVSVAIVTFDMENEVLGAIKVPDDLADQEWPVSTQVAVVGESLSLIDIAESENGTDICSIWVMEVYGVPETWTKQYTITLPDDLWDTFGFRKNGEFLVSRKHWNHTLCSCEPNGTELKDLKIRGGGEYLCVEKFVESLSLLAVGRELTDHLPRDYLKRKR